MMNDNNDIKTRSNYRYVILLSILFVITIIFTGITLSVLSPLYKIKSINKIYNPDNKSVSNDILVNADLLELKLDAAFLQSRLQLSENDSVNLLINLHDSIMGIEIKGTLVYYVPIIKIRRSQIFEHLNKSALVNYFSTPFYLLKQKSTFLKEPLIIKKAPKDTSEVSKNSVQADTTLPDIVGCSFYADKDLLINIRQFENPGNFKLFKYSYNYNLQLTCLQLEKIISVKVPDYIPWIQLEVSKKDIVSLYRSLPEHAFLSIRL